MHAERAGLSYIHPFADPAVIAGQGTIAREMLKQSPEIDVIVAGIGGGGLIAGIALAAKAMKPEIQVIGVEPIGAPTLKNSIAAGEAITLETIDSRANTLAPRRSAETNLSIIRDLVDDIVLVSDDEMRRACQWLWFEMAKASSSPVAPRLPRFRPAGFPRAMTKPSPRWFAATALPGFRSLKGSLSCIETVAAVRTNEQVVHRDRSFGDSLVSEIRYERG